MNATVDSLRNWSHLLFWLSVLLPVLGVMAGVGRYYVDRREKAISAVLRKAELDKGKKQLEQLKALTSPRILNESQQQILLKGLSIGPTGKIVIASEMDNPESSDYGDYFEAVFKKANWSVGRVRNSLNDFKGMGIAKVGTNAYTQADISVLSALKDAGIVMQNNDKNGMEQSVCH
jgi:hypothetical protein